MRKNNVIGFDVYNMAVTGGVSKTLNSIKSDADHVPVVVEGTYSVHEADGQDVTLIKETAHTVVTGGVNLDKDIRASYGFYPQMKAEAVTMMKEKSPTLVIGTNPGFQNGVVIAYDPRGNGGGGVTNTITGDHENRITDYTALAVIRIDDGETNNTNGEAVL